MKQYYAALKPEALIPKYINIFGTRYEAGQVLVLKKLSHGSLKIGLIRSISNFEQEVTFCVATFEASQSKFGYYVTTKHISPFEAVDYNDLADYYPLVMVGTPESFSFNLHHFVSEKV